MNAENPKNELKEWENKKSRNSNFQPNSNVQTYPQVHPYYNVQAYPGNPYPNVYPNVIQNVVPNDVTRETIASIGCSIFNLIFCGLAFGIPAVIFSCKASEDVNLGKTIEAQSSAKIAKILNIIGITLGSITLVAVIIYLIVYFTTTPARTVSSVYSLLSYY
jgi:hypothetical protein